MRVLGIIPARAGSKRIPNKNIKSLAGKPLIQYTIELALSSKLLNCIVVNSDSAEVLKIASGFDSVISIKRPEELASDTSPAIDYVHHTLNYLKTNFNQEFDVVVILQPTSPLTLGEDVDNTIRKLIESDADSAVSVMEVDHMLNPLKLKVMKGDSLLPYFEEENGRMAAHQLPKVFVRNCAVYVTKVNVINQGQIIGKDCRGFIMPSERSIDINSPLDFEFAEFLYNKFHFEKK